jgi:hypothetical protein
MEEDITSALLSWGSVQPYKSKVRKWDERDITIKLENLKKKLGVWPVEKEIIFQRHYTNNKVDYLNMAYYSLKDKFSKINRSKYGMVRQVEYERKERRRGPCPYDYPSWWWDDDIYNYTIGTTNNFTTTTNTQHTHTYADFNSLYSSAIGLYTGRF